MTRRSWGHEKGYENMSDLNAFLHPVQGDETVEVMISKRFLGEDGKPVPFKIRALTQEENDRISKQSMRLVKGGRRGEKEFDNVAYTRRLVVSATVTPDFSNAEMCTAYGVMDPLEVPGRMLLAGEYTRLADEISRLSGFSDPEDLEEQAKN